MTTFEMSKKRFVDHYIYGKKQSINRNMAYGSMFAEGLELDELTGDPLLDIMISRMPQLGINDKPIQHKDGIEIIYAQRGGNEKLVVPYLRDGDEKIPLLAIPDTAIEGYTAFKEYKTSVRKWTQKMVDESGQVTFYATAIWLSYGFIPEDIELVNVVVEYMSDGALQPTGEMYRFKTTRSMIDIIKMTTRIKNAWKGIEEISQQELL